MAELDLATEGPGIKLQTAILHPYSFSFYLHVNTMESIGHHRIKDNVKPLPLTLY